MSIIKAGPVHRLAVAVEDSDAAAGWFRQTFGASDLGAAGIPFLDDTATVVEEIRRMEGSHSQMFWQAGCPLLFLAPLGDGGYVHQHLRRWGPGVHSLAWEIDDMWSADARLRQRELRITGVNIPGRHFFLHPRDTDGVLIEFTDTYFEGDPRRSGARPDDADAPLGAARVAWVTAVVADAGATADLFCEITDAVPVTGNAQRASSIEATRDLLIGDVALRLVTPLSAESRYADVLERGPRLYSYALGVPDLEAALETLGDLGVATAGRDGDLAWTDPAATYGVPLEFTGATGSSGAGGSGR